MCNWRTNNLTIIYWAFMAPKYLNRCIFYLNHAKMKSNYWPHRGIQYSDYSKSTQRVLLDGVLLEEREREKRKRERKEWERERALSTYQLLSYRGLCQYTENGVTEWLLFLNLSTLSTYQNYSYRVLCEVCCIWVTEYSVSYGKIDLQSNL